jgi:predicted anti-sigma-YlaC factor YlaD
VNKKRKRKEQEWEKQLGQLCGYMRIAFVLAAVLVVVLVLASWFVCGDTPSVPNTKSSRLCYNIHTAFVYAVTFVLVGLLYWVAEGYVAMGIQF